MAKLTDAQRAFIRDNPYYGVLTTLRADGSPHSSVVWVDVDDGEVVFNTRRGRAKERHLAADPRASVLVMDPGDAYRWVAVSGPVALTTEGADAGIDALSRKYDGKGFDLRPGEVRVGARLRPDQVTGYGV
jgi:PPOX class probable F420-dependent enzyme